MSSLGVKENDNKSSTRPPPPTKRKGCSDEKSKDDSKKKRGLQRVEREGRRRGQDSEEAQCCRGRGSTSSPQLLVGTELPRTLQHPPPPAALWHPEQHLPGADRTAGDIPVLNGNHPREKDRTGKGSHSPKSTKEHTGRLTRNVPKDHVGTSLSSFGKIDVIDTPPERMHRHLSKRLRLCAV